MSSPDKRSATAFLKLERFLSTGIFVSFFMFITPVVIPLSALEFKNSGGFPSRFFIAGASMEFLLSCFLIIMHLYSGLKRRRYRQMEYLLRIIIGLPITIMLASEKNAGFSVLLRLVFGIIFFRMTGLQSTIKHYVFFFTAGMLLFSFLENYPVIRTHHVYLVVSVVLISMILAGMDNYYFKRLKNILRRRKYQVRKE